MKEKIKNIVFIYKLVYLFKYIFAIFRYPFLHQDKRLKKYKKKYVGKRCFIVATGPSLLLEDLELIKSEISFSVNSIVKCFDKTDWRPNFYVISDIIPYKNLKSNINHEFFDEVFFSKRIKDKTIKHVRLEYNNIQRAKCQLKKNFINGIKPSSNMDKYFNDNQSVVFMAIQLAVYMGFKEIYLLGQDCNYTSNIQHSDITGTNYLNHKIPKNSGEILIDCFKTYNKYYANTDITIKNCTRGGMLEIFERQPLEDVLKKNL